MKNFLVGIVIAFIVCASDQWSKIFIFGLLDSKQLEVIEIFPFFSLVKVWNYGVSFGLFDNIQYGKFILLGVSSVITFALAIWLSKVENLYMASALGLIIGGAIGNMIDRFRFGAVADFLDVYVGNYHWPAFNVADSAVCVGVGLILLEGLFVREKKNV